MLLKIVEAVGMVLFGLPVALCFLALPVLALYWTRPGKIFVPPGHVVADRGIVLRANAPVLYWLYWSLELTLSPLIGFGLLVSVIAGIAGLIAS